MIQRSITIKVKIGYIRIGYKNRHNDYRKYKIIKLRK